MALRKTKSLDIQEIPSATRFEYTITEKKDADGNIERERSEASATLTPEQFNGMGGYKYFENQGYIIESETIVNDPESNVPVTRKEFNQVQSAIDDLIMMSLGGE